MSLKNRIRAIISSTGLLTKDEIELVVKETIVKTFPKGTLLLKEGHWYEAGIFKPDTEKNFGQKSKMNKITNTWQQRKLKTKL